MSCLNRLKLASGDTGFMHEAAWMNDPKKFTRSWFAWANTYYGSLITWIIQEKPFGILI